MLQWFRPAPPAPRLPRSEVERLYPLFRWRVFEAAFIAYAIFYVVRNNFAPVSKEIGAALHYDKAMIGDILAGTAIAYGLGKFVLGYLADRSDARKYVFVGMLLTAALNFLFGATTQYWAHLILWTVNGFVQGMGYGPCTRGLSHWYSVKERGAIFGVWNISHNLGGGIAGYLAAKSAEHWGWPSAFYVPGIIATLCAGYLFWRMRDTPQSQGLPPVEEYQRSDAPTGAPDSERELTTRELLGKYIFPNKMLWLISIANIFVYIARYSMVDWGPTYLKEVKGASLAEGGFSTLVIEFAGAAGMLTMGWFSDRLGGRRGRVSVLAMVPLVLAFGWLILSGSLLLTPRDVLDAPRLLHRLRFGADPVSSMVWERLPEPVRATLLGLESSPRGQERALVEALNTLLKGQVLYDPGRFPEVALDGATRSLLATKPTGSQQIYLNRLLLAQAFPAEVARGRFTPRGLLWLNMVLFAVIGFFVYTPVMFSGVMSLDLTCKKAVGTAAGFVGFFGYVGRVIQGKGIGWVAQHHGWEPALLLVLGATLVAMVLLAFTWNVRPREAVA